MVEVYERRPHSAKFLRMKCVGGAWYEVCCYNSREIMVRWPGDDLGHSER